MPSVRSFPHEVMRERRVKTPWRARVLARAGYLTALVNREACRQSGACDKGMIDAIRGHLDEAKDAAKNRPWDSLKHPVRNFTSVISGASLERAWANIRAAELLLLRLAPEEELVGRVEEIITLVLRHLDRDDSLRAEMSERREDVREGRSSYDRELLVRALDASYDAIDEEWARVRQLRNTLWIASAVLVLGAAGIAFLGILWWEAVPLCFRPKLDQAAADSIVCPTSEIPADADTPLAKGASYRDILIVEIAGLAGAALTVVAALRRMQGSRSPFALPLAAAILKLPTGALTAFVGILLIRGAFIPGLTNLDTQGQILAWAFAFGAAQHLVTRFVDDRARETLSEAGHSQGAEASRSDASRPRSTPDSGAT